MKNLIIIALALGSGFACATTPTLTSITQPLYFLESAEDRKIQFIEVPKILHNSSAMCWIGLFSDPTAVKGAGGDLNLISLYGISVEMTSQDKDGRVTSITIDATGAKKPERYPLSVTDVVTATEKAVRIEFPDETKTKISIKGRATEKQEPSEQARTGKPTARPVNEPEGGTNLNQEPSGAPASWGAGPSR